MFVVAAPASFLLYSQRNSISRLVMEPGEEGDEDAEAGADDSLDMVLPIHGLRNIKALDYDPVDLYVYWIDGRQKSIKRAHDNGTQVYIYIYISPLTLHHRPFVSLPFPPSLSPPTLPLPVSLSSLLRLPGPLPSSLFL
jgi:hypothetical protein